MSGYKQKILNMGPCDVVWDPLGTPVSFGPFFGGVEIKFDENFERVQQDGYGNTAVDYISTGASNPVITINMACVSGTDDTQDRLAKVRGVAKVTDQYTFTTSAGESLRGDAKLVYIKPMINGVVSSDDSTWTQILVCTKPALKYQNVYDAKAQRVFKCEMYALPSLATPVGGVIIWGKN